MASKAPPSPHRYVHSVLAYRSGRTMDAEFASSCAGHKVPTNFQELLVKKGILVVEDFALMAASEAEIKTDIFEWAKAGGAELVEVKDQIAVKKLWIAARKSGSGGSSSAAAEVNPDEGIPKEPASDLLAMWLQRHGFVLPDSWLVSASNQKKIWKSVNASPPGVEVLLMEQLRMHSQRSRISGTLLNFVPGQSVQASSVDVDSIHMPIEVAARAKAWFMTVAFVSIRRIEWFDLQTAIFASEKIQDLVLATSGGTIPPVEHFNDAWTATIHFISEQVRITKQSLKTVVNNTGGWENKWQWNDQRPVTAGRDLPGHVVQNAGALKELARRQEQAQRDRQRAHMANSAIQTVQDLGLQCKGGGKGKYSGKKYGGKGKYAGSDKGHDRGHDRGHGGNRRNDDDRGDRQRHSYNGSNRERSRQRR